MARVIEMRDADGTVLRASCKGCRTELKPRMPASREEIEKKHGWKYVERDDHSAPAWWCGPCWKKQLQ